MTSGGPPVLEPPDPPDLLPPPISSTRVLLPSPPPLAAPPLSPVVTSSQTSPLRPDLSPLWSALSSHPHASVLQPSPLLASTPYMCSASPESLLRRRRKLAQPLKFSRLPQPSRSDPVFQLLVFKHRSLSPPSPLSIFQPPPSSPLGEPPPQVVVTLTRPLKSAKSLTALLPEFQSQPWLVERQLLALACVDFMVLKAVVYTVYDSFKHVDVLISPDFTPFASLRSLTALCRVWLRCHCLQLLSYRYIQLPIDSMNLTSPKPPVPIFTASLFPEPPVPPVPPEPPPSVVSCLFWNALVLRVVAPRLCSLSPLLPPTASLVMSPLSAPWTRANLQVVNQSSLPIAPGLRVVVSRRQSLSYFLPPASGLVVTPQFAPWTRAHPHVVFNQPLPLQGLFSPEPVTFAWRFSGFIAASLVIKTPWFTLNFSGIYLTCFEVLGIMLCLCLPQYEVLLPQYEAPLPLYEDVTQPLFEVPLPLYEDVTKPLLSVSVNSFVLLVVLSDETGLHSRKLRDELTNTKLGSIVSELGWWVRISSQFSGSSKRCLVISVAILLAASKALVAAVCSGNEAPSVSYISEDFIPLSTFDVIISSCFSVMFISIIYLYVSRYALVATVDLAFLAFVCSCLNNYSMDGE